jgi:hypothetical protein
MDFIYAILVLWIGAIVVAQVLGSRKGRKDGWAYAFLLGWIGVIIVACLSDKTALTAKQREVAELEAEVKLAELRQRQAALNG